MIYDSCKGCQTADGCELTVNNINGKCPCTMCVIKVMCWTTCDNFASFRKQSLYKNYPHLRGVINDR